MTQIKSGRYKKKKAEKVTSGPGTTDESLLPVVVSDSQLPAAPEERDLVSLYMREAGRYPLLSPEEEKKLAMRFYKEGDQEAFHQLAQANLRFVLKIAFEYSRYGARVLDLVQEGNVGLLKAIHEFNPYKDVRLTTYAVWWIRSYIQDFLLRNWSLVRIGTTAAQKKLFYNLKKEQQKFEREGIRPQAKMIAMNLGVEERDVKMMQKRLSGKDLSLSSPGSGAPDSDAAQASAWINRVADEGALAPDRLEENEQSTLFKKALKEFVETLESRDRDIFESRLMSEKPKTLVDIGKDYKISKERARQLEERIKEKLKSFLEEKYPDISID